MPSERAGQQTKGGGHSGGQAGWRGGELPERTWSCLGTLAKDVVGSGAGRNDHSSYIGLDLGPDSVAFSFSSSLSSGVGAGGGLFLHRYLYMEILGPPTHTERGAKLCMYYPQDHLDSGRSSLVGETHLSFARPRTREMLPSNANHGPVHGAQDDGSVPLLCPTSPPSPPHHEADSGGRRACA
jgi:hypothetical protein